jgi:hypothetical protein
MNLLIIFLLGLNSFAEDSDQATQLLKKTIPKTQLDCKSCAPNLEVQRTCPEFLSSLLDNDKTRGMYGLRTSAYTECDKPGHSLRSIFTKFDYEKVDELEHDLKNNLSGIVSDAVLNKIVTCKKTTLPPKKNETPIDRRLLLAKASYSLFKIDRAEKELYDKIAFADFVNMTDPLKEIDCADEVLPLVESKCLHLKNNCFKNLDSERSNFWKLSEKAFQSLTKLELEIADKNIPESEKEFKTKSRDLIILKFPYIASINFKKIYSKQNDKSFYLALTKSLNEDKKASLEELKSYKNSSRCFLDSNESSCDPNQFMSLLNHSPEIDLTSFTKFSNDQDHLKFNINMDAQACLARYSNTNNEATQIMNQGLRDSTLIAATAGLGALSGMAEIASLARTGTMLTKNATLLSRVALASQLSLDTYYGVQGATTAFDACTGHSVGKIQTTTNDALTCPMATSNDGISFNDQESCKLEIILAIAGGLPVVTGLKNASELTHNLKLKEKLLYVIKDFTEFKTEMIRDRNLSMTLGIFGNSPTLKSMFEGAPLKIGTLGAGKGISAEELAQRGHHVTAVEFTGKTETTVKATSNEGSITRINGTDASTVKLGHDFDLFYDTYGANAYTDKPDLLMKNILQSLTKDKKYFAFGGADLDNWAINNKIILKNGDIVSYLDWLKTIKGTKVEISTIPGKLSEDGHLISPNGSIFVITKTSDDIEIPNLENMYRESNPEKNGRMVPLQTFKEVSNNSPILKLPVTEGPHQHFVSLGLPTEQLKLLATKGKGAELTIPEGPAVGGILDSTKIKLKSGLEVNLATYLSKIPGIKVSYTKEVPAKRYIETRNNVKIFTGTRDEIKNNFRVTEIVQLRDLKIKVTDPNALKVYCQEHHLDLIGLGKPAPIKFDETGYPAEQVRSPFFIEK